MRTLLLTVLLTTGLRSHAQNWALLNPAYKYNYSIGGSDTITNQIFVTHIDTLGPDSFRYELNKVGSCGTCDYWNYDPLATELPQFMGYRCTVSQGGWLLEDSNTTFLIRPQAQIGDAWLFDPLNGTMANVVSVLPGFVLGEPDSLKTLALSTGDSIVIGRDHGLIRFPTTGMAAPELVGIEEVGPGFHLPTVAELFDLFPGDVIQYRKDQLHWQFFGPPGWEWEVHLKYLITDRQEFPDSVKLHYTCLGPDCPEATGVWALPGGPFPWGLIATAYPGKVVHASLWTPSPNTGDSLFLGPVELSLDPTGATKLSVEYFAKAWLQVDSTTYEGWYGNISRVEYREPFGFTQYFHHDQWESNSYDEYTFEMEGAVVSGDTTGVLLPDSLFTVGIEGTEPATAFNVTYSPWNGILVVNADEPMVELEVMDAVGRMAIRRTPGHSTEVVDASMLPSGIYLIAVRTSQGGLHARRVAMVR